MRGRIQNEGCLRIETLNEALRIFTVLEILSQALIVWVTQLCFPEETMMAKEPQKKLFYFVLSTFK